MSKLYYFSLCWQTWTSVDVVHVPGCAFAFCFVQGYSWTNNLLHNMHTNHSNSSFKFRAIGHKLRTCTLPTMLSISVSVLGYTGHVDIIIFAPDMIIKMFHAVLPIFQFLLVIKRASPNWRDPRSNARPLLLEKGISAWLCMYTGGGGCTAQGEFREYYGRNG